MKDVLAVIGVGTLCYLGYRGYRAYLADPISDQLIKMAEQKEKASHEEIK